MSCSSLTTPQKGQHTCLVYRCALNEAAGHAELFWLFVTQKQSIFKNIQMSFEKSRGLERCTFLEFVESAAL